MHSVGLYLGVMALCCLIAVLSCKETKNVDFTRDADRLAGLLRLGVARSLRKTRHVILTEVEDCTSPH